MDVDSGLTLFRGKAQHQFLTAEEPLVALASGYGLGKTTILLWKIFQLSKINAGTTGLVVSSNYDQQRQNVFARSDRSTG